jgi:hypothetical protein
MLNYNIMVSQRRCHVSNNSCCKSFLFSELHPCCTKILTSHVPSAHTMILLSTRQRRFHHLILFSFTATKRPWEMSRCNMEAHLSTIKRPISYCALGCMQAWLLFLLSAVLLSASAIKFIAPYGICKHNYEWWRALKKWLWPVLMHCFDISRNEKSQSNYSLQTEILAHSLLFFRRYRMVYGYTNTFSTPRNSKTTHRQILISRGN